MPEIEPTPQLPLALHEELTVARLAQDCATPPLEVALTMIKVGVLTLAELYGDESTAIWLNSWAGKILAKGPIFHKPGHA